MTGMDSIRMPWATPSASPVVALKCELLSPVLKFMHAEAFVTTSYRGSSLLLRLLSGFVAYAWFGRPG
jgi:hypothetical protein